MRISLLQFVQLLDIQDRHVEVVSFRGQKRCARAWSLATVVASAAFYGPRLVGSSAGIITPAGATCFGTKKGHAA